jgi:phytol kinase
MLNLLVATFITLAAAISWLRLIDYFAHRGWVTGQIGRKIIHIGTGPIFVICWMLFPESVWSRYLAAIIPSLISIQFFLVGMGIIKDSAAVDAMTRRGDRKEILRGPLLYGIAFVVVTVIYWKDSPIGITALMLLSGGDGFADIIGKKFGTNKLAWSKNKSWAGSIAMFVGGVGFTYLILLLFIQMGVFQFSIDSTFLPLLIIGIICTAIESLPIEEYDNLTVPTAAVLFGHLLLPKG